MADKYANLSSSERVDAAVQLIHENPSLSLRKAAIICNVHPSSISRRKRGLTKAKEQADHEKQLLTPAEEAILIKYALKYNDWGLPLQFKHLRQFTLEILYRKGSRPSLGYHWHDRLLQRNPQLRVTLSQPIDRHRASATKESTARQWFALFHRIRTEHSIRDEDIYNMDEKGFMMGVMQRTHVLIPIKQKQAFIRQDGNREWISVIECVRGGNDSEAIAPFIILKGKRQQAIWWDDIKDPDTKIATSEKGWTDNILGMHWLAEHFHPQTTVYDPTAKRLLIVDGHESHCTMDFIEFSDLHNIILLVLPPYTTHYLQPLDVACFGPLQRWYSTEVETHGRFNGTYVEKPDFLCFYQRARAAALNSENIDAGYRATGLIPYDPQRVYDKIAPIRPDTSSDANADSDLVLNEVLERTEQEISTIRRCQRFIETSVEDVPGKRILLNKIEALDAENAILLKTNAELVANARTAKRANKQLPTEGRYLSKTTAEELRAREAEKEAEKEAKKAQALEKKAAAAARKAEQQQNKVLRQARAATAAAAAAEGGEEKKRLPPRSRAKINYLLRIEEDVFE